VGGPFARANGQPRTRLAAFSLQGALDASWTPAADGPPRDLTLAADGSSIFIVGHFDKVAGPRGVWHARDSVARLDRTTGAVRRWVAGCPCSTQLFGMGVAIAGERVYVGMGGSDWVAAYDLASGTQVWRTDTNGQVQDVAVMGERLIIAGHYTYVAPRPGGSNCYEHPEECNKRLRLAALTLSGRLTAWNPQMTGDYDGVWRVLVRGRQVYAAGEFTSVGGVRQQKLARFTDRS